MSLLTQLDHAVFVYESPQLCWFLPRETAGRCLGVKGDRRHSVCISNVPCQAVGSCVPPLVEAHTVVPIGPQETQPPWDTPGPDSEAVKATGGILAGFSVGLRQSHQVHSVVEVSWKHPNKYAAPFCFSSDSKQEQQLLHFLNCCWFFFLSD